MRKWAFLAMLGLASALALLLWWGPSSPARAGAVLLLPSYGERGLTSRGALATAPAVTTLTFQQQVLPEATYSGVSDAYIDADYPQQNYGSRTELRLNHDGRQSTLLRFDVSAHIPTGAVVTAAKLEVYAYDWRTAGRDTDVGVYSVLQAWTEGQTSWSEPWDPDGCKPPGDRATEYAAVTTFRNRAVWQVWEGDGLTGLVQDWVRQPSNNHGVVLVGLSAARQWWTLYSSQYAVDVAKRPKLTVSLYVPPPTATPTSTPSTPTPTRTATRVITEGSISGQAWVDANSDGRWDAGELPLAGVSIVLSSSSHVEVARMSTRQDGSFGFGPLPVGSYVLSKEDPAGYLCTSPPGGVYAFYLPGGQELTGLDFGFALPATITPTPTGSPTATRTATATASPTLPPGVTPSRTPTSTLTPTATRTSSPTRVLSPTPTATPGGTWEEPIQMQCGQDYMGNTGGHRAVTHDYGLCGGGMWGPEVVYALQIDYSMEYLSIELQPEADLAVFVLSIANAGACVASGGTGALLPDPPLGTYYIVVDGSVSGSYALRVRCVPPPMDTPTPTLTPTITSTPGVSPTPTTTGTPGGTGKVFLPLVHKAPLDFFVDCGSSTAYVDSLGTWWLPDREYVAGSWGYRGDTYPFYTDRVVADTQDPRLYQTVRTSFGAFSYQFDVPNGTYDVVLYLAEVWWPHEGKRVFGVNIEGQTRLANYDVAAVAGGWLRARIESLPAEVLDGQLNIDFVRGTADFPMVNALRVRKAD